MSGLAPLLSPERARVRKISTSIEAPEQHITQNVIQMFNALCSDGNAIISVQLFYDFLERMGLQRDDSRLEVP
jgi:hypothetical protein